MKKNLLTISTIMMISIMSLSAQKVMVYLHPAKVFPDGAHWEQAMLDTLIANDYEVIRFYNNNLPGASADLMDSLNNIADLIIIGRSGSSGEFQSPHKEVWNSIETPVICLMPWALRSDKMNWFNTTQCVHYADSTVTLIADIPDPTDTVFSGLDVTSGTMDWAKGPYDVIVTTDGGNGKVLATSSVDQAVLMVRFEPSQEFYTGSIDVPADYRTYIGSGYDDALKLNPFNFVEGASLQVFLNEIAYLSGRSSNPVVGTIDHSNDEKFHIYPNPAANTLYIDNNGLIEKLSLIDMQGRIISTFDKVPHSLDISDLSSGFYFLRIEEKGNFVNIKFNKK